MLEIKNLHKTYKAGKKAVDDVSLSVGAGDILGFIGHNGAGKTTTLKCVAGILEFESGEIMIDGHSVKDNPMECKMITSFLPDNPDLYDNLTGIQYLNFIADVFGIQKAEREASIKKYGDMLDLTKDFGSMISSYSHGMKQKLALISAFIHNPRLLLFDEPFVGLDPVAAHTLKETMKEFCRNGAAIIFSTHVLEVAEKLCSKIAIIDNGKIKVSGSTETVLKDSTLENLFLELVDYGK